MPALPLLKVVPGLINADWNCREMSDSRLMIISTCLTSKMSKEDCDVSVQCQVTLGTSTWGDSLTLYHVNELRTTTVLSLPTVATTPAAALNYVWLSKYTWSTKESQTADDLSYTGSTNQRLAKNRLQREFLSKRDAKNHEPHLLQGSLFSCEKMHR